MKTCSRRELPNFPEREETPCLYGPLLITKDRRGHFFVFRSPFLEVEFGASRGEHRFIKPLAHAHTNNALSTTDSVMNERRWRRPSTSGEQGGCHPEQVPSKPRKSSYVVASGNGQIISRAFQLSNFHRRCSQPYAP